jgi:hypothetical protein
MPIALYENNDEPSAAAPPKAKTQIALKLSKIAGIGLGPLLQSARWDGTKASAADRHGAFHQVKNAPEGRPLKAALFTRCSA